VSEQEQVPELEETESVEAAVDTESVEAETADAPVAAENAPDESTVSPLEEFKAKLRRQIGDWYVVHTYSGYENKVKTGIETRIQNLEAEDEIFEVQVPMETVVEYKNTVKKTIRRVRVPGYVLVRMDLTDHSWGVVRHTPGVTGFVGQDAYNPVPLRMDEVFDMLLPVFEEEQQSKGLPTPQPVVDAYRKFGADIGVAFQLRDDVLGVFGDPAVTGKPAGDDLREGKRTVLVASALALADAHNPTAAEALRRGIGTVKTPEEIAALTDIISATGARQVVEDRIAELTASGLAHLEEAQINPDVAEALRGLAIKATTRTM